MNNAEEIDHAIAMLKALKEGKRIHCENPSCSFYITGILALLLALADVNTKVRQVP